MNETLIEKIAYKIRLDRDTTLYQLHNGQLVDVQALGNGKYLCFPYWEGKHDLSLFPNTIDGSNQLSEAELIEVLELLAETKIDFRNSVDGNNQLSELPMFDVLEFLNETKIDFKNPVESQENRGGLNLPPSGFVDLYLSS